MADKIDKDKKYLLQDDEEIEEAEKSTVTTYKPDEDDSDIITKALKSAKEDNVSFNDDGTISVKEDENIEEVDKTQVLSFDLKKGGDVKALQQMFDKGVDSEKITVGTDGTIQIRENSEGVLTELMPPTGNLTVDVLLAMFIGSKLAGVATEDIPQYVAEIGGDLLIQFVKFLKMFGYSVDVDVLRTKWDSLLEKVMGKYYKEGGVLEPMLNKDSEDVNESMNLMHGGAYINIDDDEIQYMQQYLEPGKLEIYGNELHYDENDEDVMSIMRDSFPDTMSHRYSESTEINLSESEIMSILFESENPRMSKTELIDEIRNQIIYEADMHDDVRRKFDSGEHDYSGHLDADTVRNISQQIFGDVQRNLRDKAGKQNVSMNDVQMMLGTSLMSAVQKEQRMGIPMLERKAVEMIRNQFNIPEGAIEFQAEITGVPQMGGRPIQKSNIQYTKGNKRPPEGKTEEELKPKVTRRRLTNAMMHGAARKSQNLHHMSDELRELDPNINNDYSKIMAANDAMYWMMSDDSIESEGRHGVHAGNVRLDLSNREKPKIIAQGVVFPILLHELAKGVLELMSLWSLPQDKEIRDYVTDKTDHLQAETNDIRLGSHLWTKFVEQIPVDNQEVISLTYNILQELPDNDFNRLMDGLLNDRDEAKNKVRELANEAIEELRREDYEDAVGGDEDYDEEETEDDVNLDDLLGGDDTEGDVGEPDYSQWSQSDLQSEIDAALDRGDFEMVSMLSQYLR